MNAFFKPEVYAASFPTFVLADDFEVNGNVVAFSLEVSGGGYPVYVAATIEATVKTDSEEYGSYFDPENAKPVDCEYLEVDSNTLAIIDDVSEVQADKGNKFVLTQSQAEKLNEWLKEYAWEQKVFELEHAA